MIRCNLKKILDERKQSQTDLWKMSGVSRVAINKYYHDSARMFDSENVSKICNALDIEIGQLLENERQSG